MDKKDIDPKAFVQKGFILIDDDHDEKISKKDIVTYYAKHHVTFNCDSCFKGCHDPDTPRDIETLLDASRMVIPLCAFIALDTNVDGLVSFDEFKSFAPHLKLPEGDKLRKLFDEEDKNKDGQLNVEEFNSLVMKAQDD